MRARCVSSSGVTVSGPRVSPASTTRLVVTRVSQATRRIGVGGQKGIQHRVAEPVGNLVGMPFGDRFGGEQELARVAHGWFLSSSRRVGAGGWRCGGKPGGQGYIGDAGQCHLLANCQFGDGPDRYPQTARSVFSSRRALAPPRAVEPVLNVARIHHRGVPLQHGQGIGRRKVVRRSSFACAVGQFPSSVRHKHSDRVAER